MLEHINPDVVEIQETIRRLSIVSEDDDLEDDLQYESIITEYVNKIWPQKFTEI